MANHAQPLTAKDFGEGDRTQVPLKSPRMIAPAAVIGVPGLFFCEFDDVAIVGSSVTV